MDDCIFCKIAADKAPSYKFYEDGEFIGFLDIAPLNKGHALVIPKKHYRWVWDYPNIGDYFEVVRKNVIAIRRALGTEFVIGAQVGDEVHHAHVVLIPRFIDDGHGSFLNLRLKRSVTEDEMAQVAKQIADQLV